MTSIRYTTFSIGCFLVAATILQTSPAQSHETASPENPTKEFFESADFENLIQSEYTRLNDKAAKKHDQASNRHIGGAICQSLYNYSFWYDFISLSNLDNSKIDTEVIKELKDPADKENKRLMFQLCGRPDFSVDPMLVQTPIKNFDEASCTAMQKAKPGIMYLIENGKCVQSFQNGLFTVGEALLTKEGKEETVDQGTWSLKFISEQKCKADETKDFTVNVLGVCDLQSGTYKYPEVKKSPVTVIDADNKPSNFKDCDIQIEYRSIYACPTQLPMGFLNTLDSFMGIMFIVFGVLMCFVGTKFIVPFVTLIVGNMAFLTTLYVAYYHFGLQSREKEQQLYVVFYLSLFFGIGVACRFFSRFKKNVVWILGAILGVHVSRLFSLYVCSWIRTTIPDNKHLFYIIQTTTVVTGCIGLACGIYVSLRLKSVISRAGTSLLGAYFLARGISRYVGNFPESFKIESLGDFEVDHFKRTDAEMFKYVWGYILGFFLLFTIGTCFQYRTFPPKKKVTDEESDDDFLNYDDDQKQDD